MEAAFSLSASRGYRKYSLAEPLQLTKGKVRDWNSCSLSITRAKRFVQLSFSQTGYRIRKCAHFEVLCSQKADIKVVQGSHIDEVYDALAERLLPTAAVGSSPNTNKYIVGLAGPPGAGKSTVAYEVVKRINKLWPEKASSLDCQVQPPDVAIVIPMDGFHLYRSELDAMENPEEAHARRGGEVPPLVLVGCIRIDLSIGISAPWTFNPSRLLTCLNKLKSEGSVYAPSFDHGVGDPVEEDIFVNIQHKVIIVEGNYLLLEDWVWKEISSLFNEKWFIDVDIDKAMQRVVKRHISTGKSPDIAKWRVENNDRPNAELVMRSKKNADIIIKSIDF